MQALVIRTRVIALAAVLLLALSAAGARAQDAPDAGDAFPGIALGLVAEGLSNPLLVTNAGDGSGRLFIVERQGTVRVLVDGRLLPEPFLDIEAITNSSCGECGLLGLAFPPDFAASGVFYASFSARGNPVAPESPQEPNPANGNDSIIARFHVSDADPNRAEAATREDILTRSQPYGNHNGGQISFGPDGMLYVTFGDGGDKGDPLNSGQRLDTLLGKVLRIEVGSSGGYTVPADNPFVATTGAKPEIWLYGLRNPWRWSFDRATGDLWLADVGQGAWEEVNYIAAAQAGGQNFGWRIREGTHCYPSDPCGSAGLTPPVFEYPHSGGPPSGSSVTGGFVYRGPYAPLDGLYIFGDYSGWIGGLRRTGSTFEFEQMLDPNFAVVTFGEDELGNLYTTDYSGGKVYRIEAPGFDWPYDVALPMINIPPSP